MNNTSIFIRTLFVLLGCFIILLPGIMYAQEAIQKPAMEFAQKSFEGYVKNVVNEKNFANFGFKSLKEAQAARLGEPYRVMIIGLKALKTYKSGTGASPLLMDAKTLWFPVMVEQETRTKLEIIERDGKWIAGEFGGIKGVKEIVMVQNRLPELLESKEIKAPYKTMLLKVPVLFAAFLYVESSKGEFLIPATLQPQRYNLQNAQIYSADEVLSKFREIAKEIDENKVM